ncbi:MAG: tetratricopeptide repeat protein [Treponemataceae bacterium]|nr:tetratricopeptide repeat protein [Spirochaetales bacterium]MDY6030952.1 tetratricopeptide repeat protein [Treponemataceae bacterium]
MANEKEEKTLESKFENFFTKSKYIWISLLCIVVVALAIIVTVLSVSSSQKNKAANFLEDEIFAYEKAVSSMDQDTAAKAESDFIANLESYVASKGKNNKTIRVYMTLASKYMEKEDWQKSVDNWQAAASCDKKSYLAGIAEFNSGVCYEQLGDLEKALASYEKAAGNKNFHLIPHALFSQARVLEALSDSEKAVEVYTKIIDTYADDEWANLAKSRIIYLTSEK